MKTLTIILAMLGFVLAAGNPVFPQGNDKRQEQDIAAIKETGGKLDDTYNRRDAEAFSALFLEDADFQWPSGAVLKDRSQVREHFASSFKTMPADYRHISTFDRIRFITPGVAIGDGTVVIAKAGAKENEKPYFSFLFTCIGKKVNGEWKVAAIRLSVVPGEVNSH
jgi:uncharacterized protein (TIGR02246 family)